MGGRFNVEANHKYQVKSHCTKIWYIVSKPELHKGQEKSAIQYGIVGLMVSIFNFGYNSNKSKQLFTIKEK